MTTENDQKAVSFRQYPAISLQAAIEAAKEIYSKEKRTVLSYESAAKAAGNASLSGPARQKLSALRKYGLMDAVGDGIQISQLALRLLHQPETNPDYQAALKEAALAPELFRKLLSTHAESSPESVTSHLILKLQFTQDGAKAAAKAFKDTVVFAKLENNGYTSQHEKNKIESDPSGKPKNPAGNNNPHNPLPPKPLQPKPSMTAEVQPGELPVPIADGLVARVPFPMSEDDFDLLIGTLQLWKKKLTRRAEAIPASVKLPANGVWKNNDNDKPVTIVSVMGVRDGETYYQSEDGTGIPGSQLTFE